jgi:signal transduction histidine kinase
MLTNLGDERAEDIRDELAVALDDLARLARGLYPIALRNLRTETALQSLAAGMAVPVRVIAHALDDLSEDQRALAYFFCSECLANISRHSDASSAAIEVRVHDGRLTMTVFDDGVGGASFSGSQGLRGLADRVETSGGTFTVDSPVGGPTYVLADIPAS